MLFESLYAFFQEHHYSGDLDGGVEGRLSHRGRGPRTHEEHYAGREATAMIFGSLWHSWLRINRVLRVRLSSLKGWFELELLPISFHKHRHDVPGLVLVENVR